MKRNSVQSFGRFIGFDMNYRTVVKVLLIWALVALLVYSGARSQKEKITYEQTEANSYDGILEDFGSSNNDGNNGHQNPSVICAVSLERLYDVGQFHKRFLDLAVGKWSKGHTFLNRIEFSESQNLIIAGHNRDGMSLFKHIEAWVLGPQAQQSSVSANCTMRSCFDFSRCRNGNRAVFIYPRTDGDERRSPVDELDGDDWRMQQVLKALRAGSKRITITENPDEACLFIPHITQNHRPWHELDHWHSNGRNHVFFTWHDEAGLFLERIGDIGDAIVAKTSFPIVNTHTWLKKNRVYRPHFDVNLGLEYKKSYFKENLAPINERKFLLSFKGKRYTEKGGTSRSSLYRITEGDSGDDIRLCMSCQHYNQPRDERCDADDKMYQDKELCDFDLLMRESKFGLVPEGKQFSSYRLAEVLSAGSIPVFVGEASHLPFAEVIDWPSFSFYFHPDDIHDMGTMLRSLPPAALEAKSQAARYVFERYWDGGYSAPLESAVEIILQRVEELDNN
eukprot:Clim_evm4s232 gene=Clim_evmTU4s232